MANERVKKGKASRGLIALKGPMFKDGEARNGKAKTSIPPAAIAVQRVDLGARDARGRVLKELIVDAPDGFADWAARSLPRRRCVQVLAAYRRLREAYHRLKSTVRGEPTAPVTAAMVEANLSDLANALVASKQATRRTADQYAGRFHRAFVEYAAEPSTAAEVVEMPPLPPLPKFGIAISSVPRAYERLGLPVPADGALRQEAANLLEEAHRWPLLRPLVDQLVARVLRGE